MEETSRRRIDQEKGIKRPAEEEAEQSEATKIRVELMEEDDLVSLIGLGQKGKVSTTLTLEKSWVVNLSSWKRRRR